MYYLLGNHALMWHEAMIADRQSHAPKMLAFGAIVHK